MTILLLNAGSSSLKTTLMSVPGGNVVVRGLADWAGTSTRYHVERSGGKCEREFPPFGHAQALAAFAADLSMQERASVAAIGHRIVHGGAFSKSVVIDEQIRAQLMVLERLAPLHNPPALETLAAAETVFSNVPHVAVFDTAFHAGLRPEAYTYPIPHQWTRDWNIRRYGFHGLSHAYCARRAAEILPAGFRTRDDLRLVICHLGHGCSASAVRGGRCVDTTMGFTPLEGMMMATRSGSIDPGIIPHVQSRYGLTAPQVEDILNRKSGLLGVSTISGDMREVLTASGQGHQQSRLALGIYTHRIRQAIGALAVSIGGVDALIFTAGVGEHAAEIRASVCTGLECLGLELAAEANNNAEPDCDVASSSSTARILVIATREDLQMWQEVTRVLSPVLSTDGRSN